MNELTQLNILWQTCQRQNFILVKKSNLKYFEALTGEMAVDDLDILHWPISLASK